MFKAKLGKVSKSDALYDADQEASRSHRIFVFKLAALTGLWWVFSSLFSVTSKQALRTAADAQSDIGGPAFAAILITCLQLCGAALLSVLLCAARGELSVVMALCQQSFAVGVLHAAGNLATNLLVVLSSVGSALAFKAAEPLFVAFFLWLLARDTFHKTVPGNALIFLAMVGLGAGVAAYKPPLLPSVVISASLCNAAFATRTVMAKQLRASLLSPKERLSQPNPTMTLIFYSCCVVGAGASVFVLAIAAIFTDFGPVFAVSSNATTASSVAAYFMYNYMSFLALDMVSSPIHSLLKVGKGLSVLLAAAVFLGERFAPVRWAGLFIATLGMASYQSAVAANGNIFAARFAKPALSKAIRVSAIFCLFFLASGLLTKPEEGSHDLEFIQRAKSKAMQAAYPILPKIFSWETSTLPSLDFGTKLKLSPSGPNDDNRDRRDSGRWLHCLQDISAMHDKAFYSWLSDPWFHSSNVLFLDPAEHSNLGDVSLAWGAHRLFSRFGYFRNSITRCRIQQSKLGEYCSPEIYARHKLAFFHAGGNWGDLYRNIHLKRLAAIQEMVALNVTFIGLPQSYLYRRTELEDLDASDLRSSIFAVPGMTPEKAKQRVTLTWREQKSFEQASKALPFVSHLLVPDLAFSTGPFVQSKLAYPIGESHKKVDIIFVWRSDGGKFSFMSQI